jgi:hypothetical protein
MNAMRIVIISCLAVSCAAVRDTRDFVPPGLLEGVCAKAVIGNVEIVVRGKTEPLLGVMSLEALRSVTPDAASWTRAAEREMLEQYRRNHKTIRIPQPSDGSCTWMTRSHPRRDDLFLQVSSPFQNPYNSRERGMLARLSLGDSPGASWFWIVLRDGINGIEPVRVFALSIDDG